MISQVTTACICNMQVQLIKTEILVMDGIPDLDIVGDVDNSVKESVKRVISALKNAGVKLPGKKVTVNFYPATVRKSGSHMDLAIAASLMGAYAFVDRMLFMDVIFIGEVGLGGKVLPVRGILPIISAAKDCGIKKCFVPFSNRREAMLVEGIEVIPIGSLQELIQVFHGSRQTKAEAVEEILLIEETQHKEDDFTEVLGQPAVKRAAKIAAAGMHSFLMIGPSGTGKTMTANRIRNILPPLAEYEKIEVTKLHSLAGLIDENRPLIEKRSLRTITPGTASKVIMGDIKRQQPGEMVLANRGILFLDELSAFTSNTLEIIRKPLDEGRQCFSFGGRLVYLPARFMLVACMNACKCGAYPDMTRCTCSISEIKRHASKITQSFLDRIDICMHFSKIEYDDISTEKTDAFLESTEMMRQEVMRAFEMQRERYKNTSFVTNRDLTGDVIRKYCVLNHEQEMLLKKTYDTMHLSVRRCYSILRVARTIADLAGNEKIETNHLIEAIGLRNIDRSFWKL